MNEKVYGYMDWPRIEGIIYAEEASPKDVMGPRMTPDGVLIQGFFPDAESSSVKVGNKLYEMEKEEEAGYFAVLIPARKIPEYTFCVKWEQEETEFADPYAFPGQITEEEEKAFCAGVYYEAYRKLGAHPMTVNGVKGTFFAVWAPNAVSVHVVGDFNHWDDRRLPMHRMPMSGIFELFVPGVKAGAFYKYAVKIKGGEIRLKTDPYANSAESFPEGASVVEDLDHFQWGDQEWMKKREASVNQKYPMSIYETSLLSWKNPQELVEFVKETGYTHVEFLPVMEYIDEATQGYSTSGYFAATSRYGSPVDFQKLVDILHQAGIGVILDWTPAQFPRFVGGLEAFDGTPLYEPADPSMAVHPMWGTMLYNYRSPMVKDFLISNACFWMEIYHADGLRMDDVDAMLYLDYGKGAGQWRPNMYGTNENLDAIEFLKHLNSIVKKRNPGVVLIAQENGLWPELTGSVQEDCIGFDYKWNTSWTTDLLSYLSVDPILRKDRHDQLTLSMLYTYCEHYVLTLGKRDVGDLDGFLDKVWGNPEQKAAQVREALAYMILHPGCKMSAPQAEMSKEWKIFLYDINELYRNHPALYLLDDEYDGFEWIQLMKYEENVITFLRKTDKPQETLLAVCNFAAIPYEDYQVGVPFGGKYEEVLNTDRREYGGNGMTNPRVKAAKKEECDEREYSLTLKLPALSVVVFSVIDLDKRRKEMEE